MAEKRDYYEVLGVEKGASEDEIEMPDITPLLADAEAEETLEPFADVDYEEELEEDGESGSAPMTPWRENSK